MRLSRQRMPTLTLRKETTFSRLIPLDKFTILTKKNKRVRLVSKMSMKSKQRQGQRSSIQTKRTKVRVRKLRMKKLKLRRVTMPRKAGMIAHSKR